MPVPYALPPMNYVTFDLSEQHQCVVPRPSFLGMWSHLHLCQNSLF